MIIPITAEGNIILGEQEQPGKKEQYVDFIGGRVDEGEDPLTAAKRELIEETGYEAEVFELWDSFQPVSKIEWVVYIFIARHCRKVKEQNLESGEKIELRIITFEQLVSMAFRKPYDFKELVLKMLDDGVVSVKINEQRINRLKGRMGIEDKSK